LRWHLSADPKHSRHTAALQPAVVALLWQLHSLNLQKWSFSWPTALVLVASLWSLWYLLRSRQLREYAADQPHAPHSPPIGE